MSLWINKTVLSGASVAANGTTSHTCTFTSATAGNLLIAVVAGAITSTTPSGWTLRQSAVNLSGIYVFTKYASAGESSFSTTHNGSNYPILGVVYEYLVGTTYLSGNSATGLLRNTAQAGPLVSGLSGNFTRFSARSWVMDTPATNSSVIWQLPNTEDYDSYVLHTTNDGVSLSISYDDQQTGASFNPSSIATNNATGTGEGVAFAVFASTSLVVPTAWIRA